MTVDKATKGKLKERYGDEQVFVVPFPIVDGYGDKFTPAQHDKSIWTKFDQAGKFIYRYDAEGEPAFQQIIPYILIAHPTEPKFFASVRLDASGEQRLHGKTSLGFGGHLNPCDGPQEVLFKGLARELQEELYIVPKTAAIHVGYVRDMTSSTNDHFGCVFVVQAEEVSVREKDKHEGEWIAIEDLENRYFDLEGWSRHVVDHFLSNGKKF